MQLLGQMVDTGEWLVWVSNDLTLSFATELEARQAMNKLGTAQAIVACAQTLTTVLDTGPDVWQEYFDVVNADGAFTDEDVAPLGITANDLVSCVTLLDNMKKFFGAEVPNPDAYRIVVNKIRRVQV